MSKRAVIRVVKAGVIPYKCGLDLQDHFVSRLLNQRSNSQNTLIVLEHLPVYTVGIRSRNKLSDDEVRLRSLGADFFKTNRGGLITFHGPGQLVAYPILDLNQFGITIKDYVSKIEKSVIEVCSDIGIEASTSVHTGVWVGNNKICAIGLHRKHNITSHGLALNCDVNLEWFDHIVPCGIVDKGVTSVSKEKGRKFPVSECINLFLNRFSAQMNAQLIFPSDKEVREEVKQILENT